ncbi:MAG TPA: HD domain-containing protein [Lachnospiraceae bacterium]
MEFKELLKFLSFTEKLKCNTRHSWTSDGRRESVAEHTYRLCVFSWALKENFPDLDMQKVLLMCLFHDLGEAITGDIPSFEKTKEDKEKESRLLFAYIESLPESQREELKSLLEELEEDESKEAHLVHALDKMEAVIQHNEASIDTWLPLEYDLQLTYGDEQIAKVEELQGLRDLIREASKEKIKNKK